LYNLRNSDDPYNSCPENHDIYIYPTEFVKFSMGASQNLTPQNHPNLLLSMSYHYIHTTSGAGMLPPNLV